MKKLILLGAIAISLVSCVKESNTLTQETGLIVEGMEVKIYTIDNCEYLGRRIGQSTGVMTHKGNCKYCAERLKNK